VVDFHMSVQQNNCRWLSEWEITHSPFKNKMKSGGFCNILLDDRRFVLFQSYNKRLAGSLRSFFP